MNCSLTTGGGGGVFKLGVKFKTRDYQGSHQTSLSLSNNAFENQPLTIAFILAFSRGIEITPNEVKREKK